MPKVSIGNSMHLFPFLQVSQSCFAYFLISIVLYILSSFLVFCSRRASLALVTWAWSRTKIEGFLLGTISQELESFFPPHFSSSANVHLHCFSWSKWCNKYAYMWANCFHFQTILIVNQSLWQCGQYSLICSVLTSLTLDTRSDLKYWNSMGEKWIPKLKLWMMLG
jgi:hypothetical protein